MVALFYQDRRSFTGDLTKLASKKSPVSEQRPDRTIAYPYYFMELGA